MSKINCARIECVNNDNYRCLSKKVEFTAINTTVFGGKLLKCRQYEESSEYEIIKEKVIKNLNEMNKGE